MSSALVFSAFTAATALSSMARASWAVPSCCCAKTPVESVNTAADTPPMNECAKLDIGLLPLLTRAQRQLAPEENADAHGLVRRQRVVCPPTARALPVKMSRQRGCPAGSFGIMPTNLAYI